MQRCKKCNHAIVRIGEEWQHVVTPENRHKAEPQPRVYLAGPMRGIKDFNFPAFHSAAQFLRDNRYQVFNPAEHDEAKHGKGFAKSETGDLSDIKASFNLRETLNTDLDWIACNADMIALLPGWEKSLGARAELALAAAIGLPALLLQPDRTADSWTFAGQVPAANLQDGNHIVIQPASGEVRITDATTGGQKGSKMERFDLIPVEPLEEIAKLYGRGALKYDDHNWRKGYKWSLSFAAMMRHAWQFWRGESIDSETKCHHLASVAWHCLTLMWYEKHRKEHDDRADAKKPA